MPWTAIEQPMERKAIDWGGLWRRFKEKFVRKKQDTIKEPSKTPGRGRGNHRKDLSRPVLQALMSKGYDTVQWDSGASVHDVCVALHGQRWDLNQFLSGLSHDAPLFERSHPGDKNCSVIVYCRDKAELKPVRVDSFGLKGEAQL